MTYSARICPKLSGGGLCVPGRGGNWRTPPTSEYALTEAKFRRTYISVSAGYLRFLRRYAEPWSGEAQTRSLLPDVGRLFETPPTLRLTTERSGADLR